MNDDTNQRAREVLRKRAGARHQFDWDVQVVSLETAEKAITSAREEALEKVLDGIARLIEQVKNRLDTDEYLDGLEDAKGVVLSLITGGGGPCSR